jgi:hypothetical protein
MPQQHSVLFVKATKCVIFKLILKHIEQDLLGQVSRLQKREELKLCKFMLEICNLKVSL